MLSCLLLFIGLPSFHYPRARQRIQRSLLPLPVACGMLQGDSTRLLAYGTGNNHLQQLLSVSKSCATSSPHGRASWGIYLSSDVL
jgi:hypothetical protein